MIEVYVTYDALEASLVKAKLADEEIEFTVQGDSDLSMIMETFNTELSRMALKQPIKFFVAEKDFEFAKIAINTDRSNLLQDDLDY